MWPSMEFLPTGQKVPKCNFLEHRIKRPWSNPRPFSCCGQGSPALLSSTTMRLLLIDNSNTRTKFAVVDSVDAPLEAHHIATTDICPSFITTLDDLDFEAVVLSSVVPEKAALFREALHLCMKFRAGAICPLISPTLNQGRSELTASPMPWQRMPGSAPRQSWSTSGLRLPLMSSEERERREATLVA